MKHVHWICGALLAAAAASPVAGQEASARVTGRVVDAETGRPVAGAAVTSGGNGVVVTTDLQGDFRTIAVFPVTLRISRMGYVGRDTTLAHLPADGGRVELRLDREALSLAGITVTVPREVRPTEAHYELSPVGIARVPPLAEPDLFRAVSTLPGIDQPNGWRSAFHVRGGASDETLILLDGIPLTEPFHMLGLFSGVQLGVVEGARMYLGAPPAHFEDRLSGIIDIRTTVPDSSFYRGHLSLLSGGSVTGRRWSGGRSGSLLLGARYATTEVIGAAIDLGRYGFADANLRLRQELAPGWTLDASGFLNRDWISDSYGDDRSAPDETTYRPDYRWGNRAGRVGVVHQSETGWRLRSDVILSEYAIRFREVPRRGRTAPVEVVDGRSALHKAALGVELPPRAGHRLAAGVDLARESFDHAWSGAAEEFGPNTPPTYAYAAAQDRVSAYLADSWTPTGTTEVSLGVRALWVPDMAEPGPYLAPRLAARWTPGAAVELFGSMGHLYQTTTQAEEAREGKLNSPRFALSEQPNRAAAAELGTEWRLARATSVRATGFAKRYGRIAQLESASVLLYPATPYPTFRFGTGTSYGVETLLGHSTPRFDAQVAYTFTHTRVRFAGKDAPPDWDAPHATKGVFSLGLGRGWRATTATTLRSGLPYTPVVGTVLLPDGPPTERHMRRNYVLGETNSRRLPPSQRVDLGMEKQGRMGSATYTLRLQVLNALNQGTTLRMNPAHYYDYGAGPEMLSNAFDRSIPLLPTVGLEIHF